jgi:FkbH-like protein
MYETESSYERASLSEIPDAIAARFSESAHWLQQRTVTAWREHCSECAMPKCFSSCDFYVPRADLKCRRFKSGIVGVPHPDAAVASLMKIDFEKWGKLEGVGTLVLHPLPQALKAERADERIARLLYKAPLPYYLKTRLIRRRSARKDRQSLKPVARDTTVLPAAFVIEAYNPGATELVFTFTIRPQPSAGMAPFQQRCVFLPGFNRIQMDFAAMQRASNLTQRFLIQLEPSDGQQGCLIYFGLLDFVTPTAPLPQNDGGQPAPAPAPVETVSTAAVANPAHALPKVKCVIWDLDNTLWKGVLIEDGLEKIRLNPEVLPVIIELDQRGILQTVASKNNEADALAALAHFGLTDYFLYPQVSWGPKSQAVAKIAKALNIGMDTLVFVDDQPFEAAEVGGAHPMVRVFNEKQISSLLNLPAFDVPVSDESRARREKYRTQLTREAALEESGGDYEAFLRSCKLELNVSSLNDVSMKRVYELAQRTNQMNFSGSRYSLQRLSEICADEQYATYVLSCRDRFGEYGIIGFAIVDVLQGQMMDLMFSCRVQSKRVEHAFIADVMRSYAERGFDRFTIRYRQTEKNLPAARFFWDMGFVESAKDAEYSILNYDLVNGVPHEDVVSVIQEGI